MTTKQELKLQTEKANLYREIEKRLRKDKENEKKYRIKAEEVKGKFFTSFFFRSRSEEILFFEKKYSTENKRVLNWKVFREILILILNTQDSFHTVLLF